MQSGIIFASLISNKKSIWIFGYFYLYLWYWAWSKSKKSGIHVFNEYRL